LAPRDAVCDPDLTPALEAAFELPDFFDELKLRLGKPEVVAWDDFPTRTLVKLEGMARLQFQAGITLLQVPALAYAAESHVRGLLECLAHVTYICSPRFFRHPSKTKALCVELAFSRAKRDLYPKLPDSAIPGDPAKARASVREEFETLSALHVKTGCRCARKADGSVKPTLWEMSKDERASPLGSSEETPWSFLVNLYDSSSTYLHQALFDRLLGLVRPGVTSILPAGFVQRGAELNWLLQPYRRIGTQILALDDDQLSAEFESQVIRVILDPALQTALRGNRRQP
jgi:hypothetical protein